MAAVIDTIASVAYAEGLRWRDRALWFSDIARGTVHRIVPGQTVETVASGIPSASGLGWTKDGTLLVASIADSVIYGVDGQGRVDPRIPFERHGCIGTNDMTCFGSHIYVSFGGKIYEAGDDDKHDETALTGGIMLIDPSARAGARVAGGMNMPNGMAVTPDGRILFVNETFGHRISRFEIGADGGLGPRLDHAPIDGMPDGMAMDAEQGLWVGLTNRNRFIHLNRDGLITETIEDPAPGWWTIACALGGVDGHTLFMAVSRYETPADLFEGRADGRILATRVSIPAAPEPGSSGS